VFFYLGIGISPIVLIVLGVVFILSLHIQAAAVLSTLVTIAIILGATSVVTAAIICYTHYKMSPSRAVKAARPAVAFAEGVAQISAEERAQAVMNAARAMGFELDPWQEKVLAAAYATDQPLGLPLYQRQPAPAWRIEPVELTQEERIEAAARYMAKRYGEAASLSELEHGGTEHE